MFFNMLTIKIMHSILYRLCAETFCIILFFIFDILWLCWHILRYEEIKTFHAVLIRVFAELGFLLFFRQS